MAGDRGLRYPELADAALGWSLSEMKEEGRVQWGVSSSRTCECNVQHHAGVPFANIAYLVEKTAKERV